MARNPTARNIAAHLAAPMMRSGQST
jgi:hypothetical protein